MSWDWKDRIVDIVMWVLMGIVGFGVILCAIAIYWDIFEWPEYRDSHHCYPIVQSGTHAELVGKTIVEHNNIVWQCDGGELRER